MPQVATMTLFFALLAVGAQLIALGVAAGALSAHLGGRWQSRWKAARGRLAPSALSIAWLVAAMSTAGSLYYSEVANFPPCPLCWYQRIAMYPLVVVLGVASLRKDSRIWPYVLPLSVVGGLLATYHYQLQRFPGQASLDCPATAPCTITYVWEFHYISIPMMALSGFAAITALVLLAPAAQE